MSTAATQSPSTDRILAVLIQCLFDLKSAAMSLALPLEALLPLLRADAFKEVLAEHLALTRQLAELRAGSALPNAINLLERTAIHRKDPEDRKIATTIIRACSIARPRPSRATPRATDLRSGRSVPESPVPRPTEQETREAAALIRSLIVPVTMSPGSRPEQKVLSKPDRKEHTPIQRMLERNGAC